MGSLISRIVTAMQGHHDAPAAMPSTSVADDKIYLGNTDVGCRNNNQWWWSHVESKRFTILNFADNPKTAGNAIEIPIFKAHGLDWKLEVYPRGWSDHFVLEYVSCRVDLETNEDVQAKIGISCGNRQLAKSERLYKRYSSIGEYVNCFARCSDPMLSPWTSYLVDGDLILDVDIRIMIPTQPSAPVQEWKPKTRNNDSFFASLWKDQKDTDIRFMVENELILAHKNVLRYHANQLLDIVLESESDDEDVVMIDGVSHDLFTAMMRFIYTEVLPNNLVTGVEDAKAVLDTADRFGCVELKLKMEYQLVTVHLNALNALDLLLFADAHSCALLKEAATRLYRESPQHIMASQEWMALVENSPALVKELLGDTSSTGELTGDKRSISALRNRLENDGLSVDGSRDTLIKRINAHDGKL